MKPYFFHQTFDKCSNDINYVPIQSDPIQFPLYCCCRHRPQCRFSIATENIFFFFPIFSFISIVFIYTFQTVLFLDSKKKKFQNIKWNDLLFCLLLLLWKITWWKFHVGLLIFRFVCVFFCVYGVGVRSIEIWKYGARNSRQNRFSSIVFCCCLYVMYLCISSLYRFSD